MAYLDDIDVKVLAVLIENARIPLKQLAERVGLSSPSCSDRLKKLEERGVIGGFTAEISIEALGYPLEGIVRVRPLPGMLHIVQRLIVETPEITQCDKVTGDDCFICRIAVRNMADLDRILDRIAEKAETNTSLIKSSPVTRRLPPIG